MFGQKRNTNQMKRTNNKTIGRPHEQDFQQLENILKEQYIETIGKN